MAKFVWHDGKWVEAVRAPRVAVFPAIHGDYMEAAWHPGTNRQTDSKSVWRRDTRASGMIEMGTDAPRATVRQPAKVVSKDNIREAWKMVEEGYRPEVHGFDDDEPVRVWE